MDTKQAIESFIASLKALSEVGIIPVCRSILSAFEGDDFEETKRDETIYLSEDNISFVKKEDHPFP